MTLMGDAARQRYPFGSNGAAQAVLDAKSLPVQLARANGDVAGALNAYDQERREKIAFATSPAICLIVTSGKSR